MKTAPFIPVLALFAAGCQLIPGSGAPQQRTVEKSAQPVVVRPEARACMADLGSKRADFTPVRDQYYGAGCATLGTVRLASIKGDNAALALAGLGPVACPLADSFAGWARYGVDRAAQQILGSRLVRIETMGSYSCRNVAGSARRSAHATANAIDVSGFVLADGRRITVADHWSASNPAVRRFFTAIHTSACKRFGTVLGPAYNAAHRDHLHLELSRHQACK